jgi:Domain of unknown function (DUF4157)
MPGFLISQSTLAKLPTIRSGDIPVDYTISVMAPAGRLFAATPQALCELLKKSGLQAFHNGKFAVSGQMPSDVLADLNARARQLFAPAVHSGPSSAAALSAQAYTTGNTVVFPGSANAQTSAHEVTHVIQQRGPNNGL